MAECMDSWSSVGELRQSPPGTCNVWLPFFPIINTLMLAFGLMNCVGALLYIRRTKEQHNQRNALVQRQILMAAFSQSVFQVLVASLRLAFDIRVLNRGSLGLLHLLFLSLQQTFFWTTVVLIVRTYMNVLLKVYFGLSLSQKHQPSAVFVIWLAIVSLDVASLVTPWSIPSLDPLQLWFGVFLSLAGSFCVFGIVFACRLKTLLRRQIKTDQQNGVTRNIDQSQSFHKINLMLYALASLGTCSLVPGMLLLVKPNWQTQSYWVFNLVMFARTCGVSVMIRLVSQGSSAPKASSRAQHSHSGVQSGNISANKTPVSQSPRSSQNSHAVGATLAALDRFMGKNATRSNIQSFQGSPAVSHIAAPSIIELQIVEPPNPSSSRDTEKSQHVSAEWDETDDDDDLESQLSQDERNSQVEIEFVIGYEGEADDDELWRAKVENNKVCCSVIPPKHKKRVSTISMGRSAMVQPAAMSLTSMAVSRSTSAVDFPSCFPSRSSSNSSFAAANSPPAEAADVDSEDEEEKERNYPPLIKEEAEQEEPVSNWTYTSVTMHKKFNLVDANFSTQGGGSATDVYATSQKRRSGGTSFKRGSSGTQLVDEIQARDSSSATDFYATSQKRGSGGTSLKRASEGTDEAQARRSSSATDLYTASQKRGSGATSSKRASGETLSDDSQARARSTTLPPLSKRGSGNFGRNRNSGPSANPTEQRALASITASTAPDVSKRGSGSSARQERGRSATNLTKAADLGDSSKL
eukprot:gb/GEZN01002385.1/.p1 GENE.gb/GEZN01002385.1/~~gb/GEZN01002385.1/.p1  ORF type:complete len:751 (-),score=98.57 gb/GEZN01002385.1/:214-2466(-)